MTVEQRIQQQLNEHKIVLYMKGTPNSPQCGFSARAVKILKDLNADFFAVDVLDDYEIREGIKQFGNWPTIPQLYINKELVGGSDIMLELFENGELQQLIAKAS